MGETSTVTIDFRINSWLENAGIVGLTRILKANPRYRRSYKEKENTLEVDPKVFDNFLTCILISSSKIMVKQPDTGELSVKKTS